MTVAQSIRGFARGRYGKVSGEFAWILVGQFMAATGGLLGVRLLTERLDSASYGELALILNVAMFAQMILFNPLATACTRFFSAAMDEVQVAPFLRSANQIFIRLSSLVLLLTLSFTVYQIIVGEYHWFLLLAALLIFTFADGYNGVMGGILSANRNRSIVAGHRSAEIWLRYIAAIGLVVLVSRSSTAAMWGFALASLAVFVSQQFFLRQKIEVLTSRQPPSTTPQVRALTHRMFVFAWPLAAWGALGWVRLASARWGLQWFQDTSTVGLYEVLIQLGYLPGTMVAALVTQLVTPILFQRAGNGTDAARLMSARSLNVKVLALGTGLLSLGMILAGLFHKIIFQIFTAPSYYHVSYLLPWIILFAGLTVLVQISGQLIVMTFDTRRLLIPKAVAAMFGVVATLYGAHIWGVEGVIIGSIFSVVVELIWTIFIRRRTFSEAILQASDATHLI